jgi:glycosyltransferase involved in cell wall biosynthesis
LRVCLVSPTCADSNVAQGGGERYVEELARALSQHADTTLVSFGSEARSEKPLPRFERRILRSWTRTPITPFSPRLAGAIGRVDVVHAFQYFTLPTFLSTRIGHRRGAKVFVTDLGGGGWTPGYQIDISRWIDGHLPISEYAARSLPGRPRPVHVIHGGVDLDRFRMRPRLEHDGSLVFLGRLLPHKGVHHLIDALDGERELHVIGPVADPAYLDELVRRAASKRVRFHHGLDDAAVVGILQRAMALVHPTPVDATGSAGANELFGLALVEAMACGCPVIASNAASLPEIVEDGRSGRLVQPGDTQGLRAAAGEFSSNRESWSRLAEHSRWIVETRFTWVRVAGRCLDAYRGANETSAAE